MKKFFLCIIGLSIFITGCNKNQQKVTQADEAIDSLFIKANGKLIPEMLWKFGRIGTDIQLSPDKKNILFGIKKYNLSDNSNRNDLYSIPVEGGDPVNLTEKMESSSHNGLWRPDGKKIACLAPKEEVMQIWEMDPDGGNARVISNVEGGINGFCFAPNAKHVLYIADVKLDKTPAETYPDLPLANVRMTDNLMYRHWDQWHDFAYSHIFIAPVKDGKIQEGKDIMENEQFDCPIMPFGGMEQIAWSPDGKKIAYACKKMTGKQYAVSTNSEIYLYDLISGETTNLTQEGFNGYDFDPVFSPDGSKLVWRSMEEDGFEADKERIMLFDFNTKKITDLSDGFDQSSSFYVWSEDGKKIYFISGIKATYQLYSVDVESKEISQITKGNHDYQSFVVAGDKLIGCKMTLSMATEIFSADIKSGEEKQLTFINQFIYDRITMGKVEERWIKTTDNKEMLTWVIYPPDFDSTKSYPALLYCQGGPQSAVSQFFSYRWNLQIMAANGYIVVAPNRRGLPTFGQEWNDQISGDYGGQNMKDYLSAIDALAKEPYVDKNRLGAVGASYGGYSVFWLAGNHEKRFKAFIAHCGIYNFESMYGSTEEYFFVNKDYEGAYWEKPKPKSYSFSPHLYVDKWDAPILIISSEYDFRIPYTQSLEAFNAAKMRGVPSKLLIFPEETHFVLKPQNAVLWQREFFAWLDNYLKK